MAKLIQDYLPQKTVYHYIGGRIPDELYEQVKTIMDRDPSLTWPKIFTACLKKFVDEMGRKK